MACATFTFKSPTRTVNSGSSIASPTDLATILTVFRWRPSPDFLETLWNEPPTCLHFSSSKQEAPVRGNKAPLVQGRWPSQFDGLLPQPP